MRKFWYLLLSIISIILFNCCDMGVKRFKPETYFSHKVDLEMDMANAIYHGDKKRVKDYINTGRVDINKPGEAGFTYLLYAIFLERYDIVRVLLELGADPNQLSVVKHPDGGIEHLTPLYCICRNHWYPIKYIKLLVKKGANVNDDSEYSPLIACIENSGKDQKKVRYLIEHGAKVNHEYKNGWTPIQTAAIVGRLDLVDMLWNEYNADPLYHSKNGTSLAFVIQNDIDNNLGTPKYIAHARDIMERLKKLGVQFPVSLKPEESVEEKADSAITESIQPDVPSGCHENLIKPTFITSTSIGVKRDTL